MQQFDEGASWKASFLGSLCEASMEFQKLEWELELVIWMVRNNISFEVLEGTAWTDVLEYFGVAIRFADITSMTL